MQHATGAATIRRYRADNSQLQDVPKCAKHHYTPKTLMCSWDFTLTVLEDTRCGAGAHADTSWLRLGCYENYA
jgi:hypothetical protein